MPCAAAIRWSGSRKAQIAGFHWKPEKQRDFARAAIEERSSTGAMDQRRQIREAPDGTPEALLRQKLAAADEVPRPGPARRRPRRRRLLRRRQRPEAEGAARDAAGRRSPPSCSQARRRAPQPARCGRRTLRAGGPQPIEPFHWEIEFPEVFDRENPGFDAFVGNPPFVGRNTISAGMRRRLPRLAQDDPRGVARQRRPRRPLLPPCVRPAARGRGVRPDRHQHDRPGRHARAPACAGSASTAARSIAATRRYEVAGAGGRGRQRRSRLQRARSRDRIVLDGRDVPIITAYLFHAGGHDDPAALQANAGKSFHREQRPRHGLHLRRHRHEGRRHRRSPRCSG